MADLRFKPLEWKTSDDLCAHIADTPFGRLSIIEMGDGDGYCEPFWSAAYRRTPSVETCKATVEAEYRRLVEANFATSEDQQREMTERRP
ncbi:hypothetical protein GRZ55_11425 [Chelativorans sp. ZYF759]|uniref:hypothetical protein n=1 Tax=Chelativorans sp. ZYF759 TaxID=2692213 RepID=UPI00145C8E04|nr:hypothetical protein [Chelativorans sp. ZYF759]NMG39855.1 hypothetical protein [Chelativorans sp. ZYF759]